MDRDLEDVREPVAAPGEERQVVVAELEVGRVEIAELFEDRVEPGVPAPVRRGEADRLEPRLGEDLVGPLQVPAVRLGVAVDDVVMAVRLGVEPEQVVEHRRVLAVGVRC